MFSLFQFFLNLTAFKTSTVAMSLNKHLNKGSGIWDKKHFFLLLSFIVLPSMLLFLGACTSSSKSSSSDSKASVGVCEGKEKPNDASWIDEENITSSSQCEWECDEGYEKMVPLTPGGTITEKNPGGIACVPVQAPVRSPASMNHCQPTGGSRPCSP